MKIKDGYILKKLAGEAIVVSALPSKGSNSIIELNESGVVLWNALKNGADINGLVDALTEEYDVATEQALSDTQSFIEILRTAGVLEE